MTEVKPFVKCVDYWPVEIPEEKLAAYKALIDAGMIQKHHILYNSRTGATTVEYYATVPHEWIKEELARASK